MKQIIFRVDDRLIHGQVIEGWIKNFKIADVIIVSDRISVDPMQQMIYQSVVPPKTTVSFTSLEDFINNWPKIMKRKGALLVLFSNIKDLAACEEILSEDVYINIGCIASGTRCIEISDTVFLEQDEMDCLTHIASLWKVHIKKLPWEKDISFCEAE